MPSPINPPGPRPCESCPYRQDVPSGLWDRDEYAKLTRYDTETSHQPQRLFLCHQTDPGHRAQRICAGWAGCHDGANLLALRVAAVRGRISTATYLAVVDYVSPVPLFASGAQAEAHGLTDIDSPGHEARKLLAKIGRVRTDLVYRKDDQMTNYRVPIHLQQPPAPGFAERLFDLLGVYALVDPSRDPQDRPGDAVIQVHDRLFVAQVTISPAALAAMTPPGHTVPPASATTAEAVVARALRGLGYDKQTATIEIRAITVATPADPSPRTEADVVRPCRMRNLVEESLSDPMRCDS